MKVGETDAIARKLVNVWGPDLAAKAGQITKTQVVGDDDKEIGTLRRAIGGSHDSQDLCVLLDPEGHQGRSGG